MYCTKNHFLVDILSSGNDFIPENLTLIISIEFASVLTYLYINYPVCIYIKLWIIEGFFFK